MESNKKPNQIYKNFDEIYEDIKILAKTILSLQKVVDQIINTSTKHTGCIKVICKQISKVYDYLDGLSPVKEETRVIEKTKIVN